ncbi:hypothetical protein [Spirosoma sp.]|uniref:hypothetical protein n=1 Tax=Spirosoma sp. TaxID=1899569 RepID=UPI002602776B|nr:hypothetical protein [Spirosoma sp.]MCX6217655.1 hypothetical protein [Spirosoma sp.]
MMESNELKNREAIEDEFFYALSNLCQFYGWPAYRAKVVDAYPGNIAQAFAWAQQRLEKQDESLHLLICQDEQHAATLATAAEMGMDTELFYIPVRPYYHQLKDHDRRDRLALLDCLYCYLNHIVEIPFFTENGYIGYQYHMVTEGVEWEDEDEETKAHYRHMEQYMADIQKKGQACLEHFNHAYVLLQFADRLEQFKVKTALDETLKRIAQTGLELYREFPHRSIMEHCDISLKNPEEQYGPDFDLSQTMSFYWIDSDDSYEAISHAIDSDFGEAEPRYPTTFQFFDTPQTGQPGSAHDFSFHRRVMKLIHTFTTYLYKLDAEYNAPVQ